MTEQFNRLSPAESERLYLLLEELGEVQHIIGKTLRHGYSSKHPKTEEENREALQRELGDLVTIMGLMVTSGDINKNKIDKYSKEKILVLDNYLHYNTILNDIGEENETH